MLANWQLTNTSYGINILKHCSKASHVLILVFQEEIYPEVMIEANANVPGSERPTSQTQSRIWKGAHTRKRFKAYMALTTWEIHFRSKSSLFIRASETWDSFFCLPGWRIV